MQRHSYTIWSEKGSRSGKPIKYNYGNINVDLYLSSRGFLVSYSRPKYITELLSDKLVQDAIKKAELLYLLRYSRMVKYDFLYASIDNDTICLFDSHNGQDQLVYSMFSEKLYSKIPETWQDDYILSFIANTAKSSYDRRFAALFAFIMAKSKLYEAERFIYLWMSMNGLYGYMAQNYHENIRKEWRQIKLLATFYGFHYDSRYKDGEKNLNLNIIRGEATALIENLSADDYETVVNSIHSNRWDDNLTGYRKCMCNILGDTAMDPMGFFILWIPYQLRCKLFHGEKTIPLMSFVNESPLPVLAFVNNLLEDFLDKELVKWFNEELHDSELLPKIKELQV